MPNSAGSGLIGGLGEGISAAGTMMMKNDMDSHREQMLSKLGHKQGMDKLKKTGQIESAATDKQNIHAAKESEKDRLGRERVARINASRSGSGKWDPAKGMSLSKRQEGLANNVADYRAKIVSGEIAIPAGTDGAKAIEAYKSRVAADFGLTADGRQLAGDQVSLPSPSTNIKTDPAPDMAVEKQFPGLLNTPHQRLDRTYNISTLNEVERLVGSVGAEKISKSMARAQLNRLQDVSAENESDGQRLQKYRGLFEYILSR